VIKALAVFIMLASYDVPRDIAAGSAAAALTGGIPVDVLAGYLVSGHSLTSPRYSRGTCGDEGKTCGAYRLSTRWSNMAGRPSEDRHHPYWGAYIATVLLHHSMDAHENRCSKRKLDPHTEWRAHPKSRFGYRGSEAALKKVRRMVRREWIMCPTWCRLLVLLP
jgi:hypothetical protein